MTLENVLKFVNAAVAAAEGGAQVVKQELMAENAALQKKVGITLKLFNSNSSNPPCLLQVSELTATNKYQLDQIGRLRICGSREGGWNSSGGG